SNISADVSSDVGRLAEQTHRGGNVEKRLVERERFHQWRVALENREYLFARLCVSGEARWNHAGVRCQFQCARHRHRAVYAEGTYFVRCGQYHTTLCMPADDERLTL